MQAKLKPVATFITEKGHLIGFISTDQHGIKCNMMYCTYKGKPVEFIGYLYHGRNYRQYQKRRRQEALNRIRSLLGS